MTFFHRRVCLAAAAGLISLSAGASAQSLDGAASHAPALSIDQTVGVAAPAQPLASAARTLVTKDVLRDLSASANRDWKNHTMSREYKEDFDCPLSFAFAGELRGNGYKGLKLLGTTVPISKPADSAP